MPKTNRQKIKEIDEILEKYKTEFSKLKRKRNAAVFNFIEALKQKRIEEIKNLIQQL